MPIKQKTAGVIDFTPQPRPFLANSLLLRHAVTFAEQVNATFRIDERLLSRKIGMTSRTCVDGHRLNGRAGFNHIAAGTRDGRRVIIGVDLLLHGSKGLSSSSDGENLSDLPCQNKCSFLSGTHRLLIAFSPRFAMLI